MEGMHYSTAFKKLKNCTLCIAEVFKTAKKIIIITYSVEDKAYFHNMNIPFSLIPYT